ncbi:MAG: flippase [Nanoarchaeota archaeon]
MNYTKKAIKGATIIFVLSFFAAIFGYLLRIVLARNLTIYEYGAFYSITALFGLFSLFQNLGLNETLVRYIAKFKAEKNDNKIKSSIVLVILIQLLSTTLIGLIFIVLSNFIAINYFHDFTLSIYIKIYAISIILSPSLAIFNSIFQGYQRMFYFSLVNFLQFGFIFLITYFLLHLGYGLFSPFLAYVLVYILVILFYFIFIRKIFPSFWQTSFSLDKKQLYKFIKFGSAVILTGAAGIVFNFTDTFMITFFRSLTEVGLYNASYPTAKILWGLSGSLTLVLLPLTSELWANKDILRIKEGIRLLYKFSLITIFPISLLFIMFPEFLLSLLFGPEYVNGANVLRLLGGGTIFYIFAQINNSVLTGIGKPRLVSKNMLFAAGLNVIMNLFLIPPFGIDGAAISTVISFFIIMVLSYFKLNKNIKISLNWKKIFLIILSSIIFLIGVTISKNILVLNPWLEVFCSIIISGVVYLGCIFLFKILTLNELKQIFKRLK